MGTPKPKKVKSIKRNHMKKISRSGVAARLAKKVKNINSLSVNLGKIQKLETELASFSGKISNKNSKNGTVVMLVKYVGEIKYVGEEFSVCW